MELRGIYNERYITARELGRGGEGTVYELSSHSGLVLKKYNDTLTADKIAKLRQMVAMRTPGIEAYAAWPADIVTDDRGFICGFTMKKLSGYVPLHMIFSPMDRKKMFPDKGYNFLVHVARNLATAFHKLHEAGLVVGDVNEGNILISASGMVAFIDCDSFQVKGENDYYYCEVGVPRYTPPELLKEGSFDNVLRTVNTDSFSMAVLIFQLLFLGRHPYAGRNKTAADIDEETAIRQQQFAYSLYNKKKKLSPPVDSFDIANLPDDVVTLFHQAFEQDVRPVPSDWVRSLDALLGDMITCDQSTLHTYPGGMPGCPWCAFKAQRGILYFLDDSYIKASAVLNDIDGFVNGFKLEKMELKPWAGPLIFPGTEANIDPAFYRYNKSRYLVAVLLIIVSVVFSYFVSPIAIFFGTTSAVLVMRFSLWAVRIKKEMQRRTQLFHTLHERLGKSIDEYNRPADLATYNKGLSDLQRYVHDFRRLPEEFDRRRRLMEEKIYSEQLYDYLYQFRLEDHDIPSIGATRKTSLYNNGIVNAAHIAKLTALKIPGIGPKNQQVLLSWQRQMSSGFIYMPDTQKINSGLAEVNKDVAMIRTTLESIIRKEYHSLNYVKQNISNRGSILARQIGDIALMHYQAEVDVKAFQKLVGLFGKA